MTAVSPNLDEEEQRARIRRMIEETEKLGAKTRKLLAEVEKYRGDSRFQPWSIIFQGALAVTAVVGAGVAIATLFLT